MKSLIHKFTEGINSHPYIISIKTASIKLLPITVMIAFTTLIMSFSTLINPVYYESSFYKILSLQKLALTIAFPYVAIFIIAHSLNKLRKGESDLISTIYPVISLIIFNMVVDNTLEFGLDIKFLRAILIGLFTYEYELALRKLMDKLPIFKKNSDERNNETILLFIRSIILLLSITIFSYLFLKFNIKLDLDPSKNIKFENNIFDAYKYLIIILMPWIIGINGSHLVSEAYTTIYNNFLINQEMLIMGELPSRVFDFTFFNYYLNIGGSGATLCLVIALFMSRKKAHRRFAKIALIPSIFNINEILIFGFPIVANFYMIIPFVLVPMIFATITYFALISGLVPIAVNQTSWIMPPILNIFLATDGEIRAILLQLFLITIGTMIYSYFLKKYDGINNINLPVSYDTLNLSQDATQVADMQLNILKEVNEAKNALKPLLDDGEFILYYQPIYEVASGKMTKVEALVRINHSSKGIIPPYFLGYFEKLGRSREVDYWVIENALKSYKYLNKSEVDLDLAINISAQTFTHDSFLLNAKKLLIQSGVNPKNVIFELVEESFIEDLSGAREKIKELKDMGIRIAIDDFGTGYSSLNYLMELNVDIIKIDRKFVISLKEERGKNLMLNIINMIKALECSAVVEGVEEIQEVELLKSYGADFIQGFYYSRPKGLEEVVDYMEEINKNS